MKAELKILVVEDMESFRGAVTQLLGVFNDIQEATNLADTRALLTTNEFDVVILDKGLPDGDGETLIQEIKAHNSKTVIIILTSDSEVTSIRKCIALGADDYVVKSSSAVADLLVRIPITVAKAAQGRKLATLERTVKDAFKYELVGTSPSTMELREFILQLKGTQSNVLITGESGTGKELIARRLNSIEGDPDRPLVAVNCSALTETLVESELFGHKKGAFTGAIQDQPGKFELADGGDIFLDEIGELPLATQAKLLRVIQEGEVCRVGDSKVRKVRFRLIAATNQNLEKMVAKRKFREDLYHRINVIRIRTTPLRERRSDINDLIRLFLVQMGGPSASISDHARKILLNYEWPGNIRELRNAIERGLIYAKNRNPFQIQREDVLEFDKPHESVKSLDGLQVLLPEKIEDISNNSYQSFMNAFEKEYLSKGLQLTNGDVSELADRAGISRSHLYKKIKWFGLNVDRKSKSKRSSQPLQRSFDESFELERFDESIRNH